MLTIKKTFTLFNLTIRLFFLLILCGCNKEQKETEKKQPNILFIMSDDHTSQAWGIYGGVLKDYVHH